MRKRRSPKPPGDRGQLNNRQAAALLQQVERERLQQLVVAHISEANNRRDLAAQALAPIAQSLSAITWASQTMSFDWLQLN